MSRQPTEADFLKDVADHKMKVVHESALHRHLNFSAPDTYCGSFHITTWPGYLTISGDMGCYVFSRIQDMFQFFRSEREGPELRINLGYWAEKIEATNKHGGHLEFSRDLFCENIVRWMNDREATDAERREVDEEVLCSADDGEYAAIRAAMDFKGSSRLRFTDFYEVNCREYTWHFVWCCYAIAWAIRQYDAAKASTLITSTESGQ